MKNAMKFILSLIPLLLMAMIFTVVPAHAQSVANPDLDFLSQVLDLIKSFGGLPWAAKVGGIIMLVIGSMKVSFAKPLWDKLGAAQAFVAPILAMMVGALSMSPFSWAGMGAYLAAGAGAIAVHELLDALKSIPGLGPVYVAMISWLESVLGSPSAPAAQ